jgi:FMN phosphatase YigB (HAD superfamily)
MSSRKERVMPTELAFLLDVDNTLLDNDRVKRDLQAHIDRLVGLERGQRFWALYEEVRQEADYVDFPLTLRRFHATFPDERRFPHLAALLLCFPYERWLFPGALEAIAHLKTLGRVAIVSDGDPVFQPAKIAQAGLADAVDDNVMIFVHKEQHLDEVTRRLPAERYVLVDDKPRILAAAKARLGERLVTLHVCQGAYAHSGEHDVQPAPDRKVGAISELQALGRADLKVGGK